MTLKQSFIRFSRSDRIEHLILLVSFTVLVITGIPQKYVPAVWAETMIGLMGGIEIVRIIHRIAAVILIVESIYHIVVVGYKLYVRRTRMSMLPVPKDIIDFLDILRYNLGLARNRPKYDRFSFEEKLEYWAVVWGTAVMVVTGFMLWNPISTSRFLPGSAIPAAKAAHGGEALLAFLAILVWHVYNVHFKTFNRSMFTGKLSREEMEHEHAAELERIEAGMERPEPPREVIRRRERIYLPIVAVATLMTVIILFFFVTYEETAIATIPTPLSQVPAFVKATPTPVPTRDPADLFIAGTDGANMVPHAVSGRENCLSCHGLGAIYPYTQFHADLKLGNETCLSCHALQGSEDTLPTVEAGEVPSFATDIQPVIQAKCTACHGTTVEPSFLTYQDMLQPASIGFIVVPGQPADSRLLIVQQMPIEAHPTRLTTAELETVNDWIAAGAPNN